MSEVKWTKEQESAIYEDGKNILVAAAAGSGKTAVLVERIINKIVNENVDIDKILVVTFTNAAASEMRERILDSIYKKIEENPKDVRLQRQLTLLNKANISTIHSFCMNIIKNYFYELDISANFRVGEQTEIELLKQETIEELFEEKYFESQKNSKEKIEKQSFLNLINTYTDYRDDEPLKELVLKIYRYMQNEPFPHKWLEEKIQMFNLKDKLDMDYSKTIWGKILIDEYKEKLLEGRLVLESIRNKMLLFKELYEPTQIINKDIDTIKELEKIIESDIENKWDLLYEKAQIFDFDKWSCDKNITIDLKDEAKALRLEIKGNIRETNRNILIYDSRQANEDIYSMYENLVGLRELVYEFEKRFLLKKREKNIVDFNDIEHFALKILIKEDENGNYVPTDVANKIKENFEQIAIDEYQDSNLVQEYILNSISTGNNIFMVGDVKQSIYKFRGGRPELFLEKYNEYELIDENNNSNNPIKIKLFKNFRSRENVLNLTNAIFEQVMSKDLGDIDYTEEEYLNLGADYPILEEKNNKILGKAELHIIDLAKEDETYNNENKTSIDEKEPIENTLIEAKFVADKIEELISSNYIVYDKKEGYRKVTYKDIVILLRAPNNIGPIYEKELSERSIPVYSDSSSEYLESTEIQTIMSVLKIINNPYEDISLITVLRSSIGNFTDNDLVEIRLADKSESFYNAMLKARISVNDELKNKIDIFINQLEKWKNCQEYMSLDELIWKIYSDSNYYNYVGLLNNGNLRQANLKMLFEKAKQYESASFKGLYNFIVFVDKMKLNSKDTGSAKIIGENDNVVRIMSIHKSKGLEFPIVFLCNTSKQFNFMDLNDDVLIDHNLGFGLKYIDYEKGIEYNTLSKEALRIKMKNEIISEEMRVLYVALTRAKEKLYITGVQKDFEKSLKDKEKSIEIYNSKKLNKNVVGKYKTSYLDWIQLAYLNDKKNMEDIIEVFVHKNNITDSREYKEEDLVEKLNKKIENEKTSYKDEVKEILNWEYKYKLLETIPTKTSVSKIKEEKNKDKGLKGLLKSETEEDSKVQYESIENNLAIPEFMKEEKITSAQKGTLMHFCIKNLNEKKHYEYEDIKQEIEELRFKNLISEKEAEVINLNTLFKYTKSNLFNELSQAKEVHKEEPFYINVSSNEIYENGLDENILVQGIIDLYFIDKNDKLILVDYKTDFVNDKDELKEKYKEQLELYKSAIEKSLNRKVDKVIIYSLYLQEEIIL